MSDEPGTGAASPPDEMPAWVPEAIRLAGRRLLSVAVVGAVVVLIVLTLLGKLTGFFTIIFLSFFLSFAIEPAVDYLATRRGWRRGAATGLVFLVIAVGAGILIALVVPAVVQGFQQLVNNAPDLVGRFATWLQHLGVNVSQEKLTSEITANSDKIIAYGRDFAGNVFGIAASILGGVFRWATIALFTFYIVAEGPKLRRVILSMLPPERQKHVLFVWEMAIRQTGGYFYSRLLLAIINGSGMFITLRVMHVPFAAPLAIFEGVVAEFIPIVGTYIAGAPPVLVAFLYSPTAGAVALAYILIYQQIENYFLSPRLTARTMSLHPAMAFAAAYIGGSLGGLMAAFLALPVAGVIQASASAWRTRYEVVEDQLTQEAAPRPERHGFVERLRANLRDSQTSGED